MTWFFAGLVLITVASSPRLLPETYLLLHLPPDSRCATRCYLKEEQYEFAKAMLPYPHGSFPHPRGLMAGALGLPPAFNLGRLRFSLELLGHLAA